jgi:hypothetical protein
MLKIVINACFGSYGLSKECIDAYNAECGTGITRNWEIDRADPVLVRLVEEMGDRANAEGAKLSIIEIPDDEQWTISHSNGLECVLTKNTTWHPDVNIWKLGEI